MHDSHAMDDGHIDKKEQKAIDEAHERQLLARGRGKAQVRRLFLPFVVPTFAKFPSGKQLKPYRTTAWIKNGIKSRLMPHHTKSRERKSWSANCNRILPDMLNRSISATILTE
jgi:hypothetical protein